MRQWKSTLKLAMSILAYGDFHVFAYLALLSLTDSFPDVLPMRPL